MPRFLPLAIAAILLTGKLQAQPSDARVPGVEEMTVTAARDRRSIQRFIETFAAPTAVIGKLARWETGICPVAVGLRPAALNFIMARLRVTAAKVGAPVNRQAGCKPNIEIVFTTTPQGLLDNVRKEHVAYLGYAGNSGQVDRLAMVVRPIQAWYTTQSRDLMGLPKIDSARTIGLGDPAEFAAALAFGNTTGLRNRDGRRSELYHVIIAIDPAKLADHEIGGIADYITFLSLSQLASLDRCQTLPSIIDMLVAGCPPEGEMTANDQAFLRGLYTMSADGNLRMQEDEITAEMAKALAGD